MKIHAIIPARGGSKSVPKKNIQLIGKHPLIAYSIVACKLCKNIDRVIVSTDNEEIAGISKDYGAEVPFMRPKEYATDASSDFGFLKHFFDNISCEEVALIRPTTPFRNPEFMEKVIGVYFENKDKMTGLRTAEVMNQPAYKQFKINGNYFEELFESFNGIKNYSNLPRQQFPLTYSPNGHIDIVKRETIKESSVFGDKIYAVVCGKMVDIDDMDDLEIAGYLVGSQFDCLSKYIKEIKK
jgi:N-acylneuraminate cytidylyltransferase